MVQVFLYIRRMNANRIDHIAEDFGNNTARLGVGVHTFYPDILEAEGG